METETAGWWNQKCGPREILAISLPLIASTISHTVMQFCDRMFLAWYSNDALAAVLPAGALSWTLASLPLGITMYCATFVAQYFGAEQSEKIGKIVWQGIWIGVFLTPLFILLGAFSESFFLAIGHSDLIASLEYEYFFALSLGSGAMVLDGAVSSFFIGRGKTNTVMWVNIFAASLNLVLDYLFIFGGGPIPAMGLWGAGIATTIATWTKVGIFYWMFSLGEVRGIQGACRLAFGWKADAPISLFLCTQWIAIRYRGAGLYLLPDDDPEDQ